MSPRPVVLRLVGLGWALAAMAGCGAGTTEPTPAAGLYVLQTLNESALPYDHEGLGCCIYLSGQLELGDGRYTASITARNRNTLLVFTAVERGSYSEAPAALTFVPESFDVSPLGLDAGVPSGNGLRVTFGGEGPGSPDQFRAFFVRSP